MMSTIKASVLYGPMDLREDYRELDPPAADEVQVAVKSTGLCGSDLHFWRHASIGDIKMSEPMSLGHESAGVVTAVGAEVQAFQVGDRVALEVGQPCEACEFCKSGRYNICRDMRFRASARLKPHVQGTLQERINHPAKWAYKLPEDMPLEFGALAEPLSVAIHANNRAAFSPQSNILVMGAGTVGLLCAAVSRLRGARSVVMADIDERRVDFAVAHGFADAGVLVPTKAANSLEEKLALARGVAETIKATAVKGVPFGEANGTFECTGIESAMQTSIYSTQPGSKVMIVGLGSAVQTLPIADASRREVDLVGVFRYANTYSQAVDILERRGPNFPDLSKLITHRFQGMSEIPKAFKTASRTADDNGNLVLKVIVEM